MSSVLSVGMFSSSETFTKELDSPSPSNTGSFLQATERERDRDRNRDRERDKTGKMVVAQIISTSENDQLSLEPQELYNHNDLDLFSSYAESSCPSPLNRVSHPSSNHLQTTRKTAALTAVSSLYSLSPTSRSSPVRRSNTTIPPMHQVLLPTEESWEALGRTSHHGRISSATLKRRSLKSRGTSSSLQMGSVTADNSMLMFSTPSINVIPLGLENDRPASPQAQSLVQRQPIFRPLPGKRLSSNPYTESRSMPNMQYYRYSATSSQELPPLSLSSPSVTSGSSFGLPAISRQESTSLQNLSIETSDPIPEIDNQPSTQTPPERPMLGGHLEGNVIEPPPIDENVFFMENKDSPPRRTRKHHSNSKNIQLLHPGSASVLSTSNLEPVPYQVHSRVLGWKLTSVQRRKELIDVLDMMKERSKLTGGSSKISFTRKFLTNLSGNDFARDMHQSSANSSSYETLPVIDQNNSKLTVREVEAWQHYVTRRLKSRQGYKNVKQIRTLMEEKRKTEKLTEISSQRYELLRNRQGAKKQNILNERSTDDVSLAHSQEILRQTNLQFDLPSPAASPPPSPSAQHHYLLPTTREKKAHLPRNTSPTEYIYNFPVDIHKTRDRMDILESVAMRGKLEERLAKEKELKKEAMIEQFIQQGGGFDNLSEERSAVLQVRSSSGKGFEALGMEGFEQELNLLGLDDGAFDMDDGSGFAYLDELNLNPPDAEYDPDQVDSIIEKFGGAGGGGGGDRAENRIEDDSNPEELNVI